MHHESRQVEYAYLSDPTLRAVSISPSAATLLSQRRATGSTPNNAIAAISLLADASWEKVYEHQAVFQISEGATTPRRQRDNTSVIAPPFEFPNQEGREYISISFNAPVTTRGISLDLGKRASDFPRGLSIFTGTCENPGAPLADYPDWQGALALSPNGYPYFLTQSDVRIAFAQEATFSALCIGQTRKSDFDWYVKSIQLMKASTASTDQERR